MTKIPGLPDGKNCVISVDMVPGYDTVTDGQYCRSEPLIVVSFVRRSA